MPIACRVRHPAPFPAPPCSAGIHLAHFDDGADGFDVEAISGCLREHVPDVFIRFRPSLLRAVRFAVLLDSIGSAATHSGSWLLAVMAYWLIHVAILCVWLVKSCMAMGTASASAVFSVSPVVRHPCEFLVLVVASGGVPSAVCSGRGRFPKKSGVGSGPLRGVANWPAPSGAPGFGSAGAAAALAQARSFSPISFVTSGWSPLE